MNKERTIKNKKEAYIEKLRRSFKVSQKPLPVVLLRALVSMSVLLVK
mgnify:CR=1 FL=1